MGLIWDDELERIPVTDGEWVDIKPHLSRGDLATVGASAFRGVDYQLDLDAGERRRSIDSAALIENAEFATLEVAIRAWSFTRAGEPVPVTPENIRRLSNDDYEIVQRAINLRNPRFTPAERKASSTPPSEP